jgi:hypothetical protein
VCVKILRRLLCYGFAELDAVPNVEVRCMPLIGWFVDTCPMIRLDGRGAADFEWTCYISMFRTKSLFGDKT